MCDYGALTSGRGSIEGVVHGGLRVVRPLLQSYVRIVDAVVLALGDDFGVDGGGGGGLLGAELEAVGQDVELDALLRHGPGHHHALVV